MLCKPGFYGELELSSESLDLRCKSQGEEFQGCISVVQGKCTICDRGFFMTEKDTCRASGEQSLEDESEDSGGAEAER